MEDARSVNSLPRADATTKESASCHAATDVTFSGGGSTSNCAKKASSVARRVDSVARASSAGASRSMLPFAQGSAIILHAE